MDGIGLQYDISIGMCVIFSSFLFSFFFHMSPVQQVTEWSLVLLTYCVHVNSIHKSSIDVLWVNLIYCVSSLFCFSFVLLRRSGHIFYLFVFVLTQNSTILMCIKSVKGEGNVFVVFFHVGENRMKEKRKQSLLNVVFKIMEYDKIVLFVYFVYFFFFLFCFDFCL